MEKSVTVLAGGRGSISLCFVYQVVFAGVVDGELLKCGKTLLAGVAGMCVGVLGSVLGAGFSDDGGTNGR